jgi:acyl carrier protein
VSDTLGTVTGILRDVLELDAELGLPLTAETSFSNDLEIESIELVSFVEKLQACYDEVNFVDWLSHKELDEIIQLTVGDVVAFIDQCHSSTPTD